MKLGAKLVLVSLFFAIFLAGCSDQEGQVSSLSDQENTQLPSLTADEAKNKAIDYLNKNMVAPGTKATVKSIEDKGNVYEVAILYQGKDAKVYITKDGEYLLFNAVNMSQEIITVTPTAVPTSQETPEYSTVELQKFIDCLDQAGTVIYGAKWCGYCKQLVSMLGGYDIVDPIYVECTENEELCNKEGVSAYPTIKIAGSKYSGMRSFEGLSEATGCPVPE